MATLSAVQNAPKKEQALNPFVAYDPHKMVGSNKCWSRIWQIAALVTAAVFIALAVVAIIYTTVHFPTQLPTVSILVFAAGMPTSFRAFKYLWDKKDAYAKEAAIDQKLIEHMEENPDNVDADLKSVHARFSYFRQEKENHVGMHKGLIGDACGPTMGEINFSDKKEVKNFQESQRMHIRAAEHLTKAAICNLQSAYFLHVEENPHEHRPLADFFDLKTATYLQQLVAKDHGDETTDVLLKTANKTYTQADLLKKTPDQLKREIFEGKNGWFSGIGIG
ncbi:MAG: hypothetical protein K940chlam6_00101 [Chlamydiae bacterium]|nr:hypothetical protein [Chlamydiota bacterium]